jgi:hypothetical protein
MLCNITPWRASYAISLSDAPLFATCRQLAADAAAATPLFRRYELAMPPLISVTRTPFFAAVRAAMPRRYCRLRRIRHFRHADFSAIRLARFSRPLRFTLIFAFILPPPCHYCR